MVKKQDEFVLLNSLGQSVGNRIVFDYIEENLQKLTDRLILNF